MFSSIHVFCSTIRSIVITSSSVAATPLTSKGEVDESHWNTECVENVKQMKGELSFFDKHEVYSASKVLAEQG